VSQPPESVAKPTSRHVPVLMREVLRGLALTPGLTVVDGTIGGGGHSLRLWPAIQPGGRLLGLDRDPMMLNHARHALAGCAVEFFEGSYLNLRDILDGLGIAGVDRILVDLGLSSDQLDDAQRGFSFQSAGPLDLRFNPAEGLSAADWLKQVTPAELERILRDYGEEPESRRIAAALIARRVTQPIETARELAELIVATIGTGARDKHPATRVFQALRIAVNHELDHVRKALEQVFPACLQPGGLLAVITFHSLEDRLAKEAFKNRSLWEAVTAKPLVATPTEQRVNPRSRSAKLRIARRQPMASAVNPATPSVQG
jgi:16S rRNA (cytosine1402-N4)-methyltransferase